MATRSASFTGCSSGTMVTAEPTRMVEVRPSRNAAMVRAELHSPYRVKWCSSIHTP